MFWFEINKYRDELLGGETIREGKIAVSDWKNREKTKAIIYNFTLKYKYRLLWQTTII